VAGQARRDCRTACAERSTCTAPGAGIRTLAYVVSTCTVGGFHQKLQIRQGNCDPVIVLDLPEPWEVSPDVCARIGRTRIGTVTSPIVGAFHRMGVSPDGRHVVLEVTDDFSVVSRNLVPPEQQEGIFIVRADGHGLRRLGPASRDAAFRYAVDPASPIGVRGGSSTPLSFSPDGQAVVLTDLGPGPGGEEAIQIFTLDIVTGSRSQLTHLPFVADRAVGIQGLFGGTCCPHFLTDGRIAFLSLGNVDGSNLEGNVLEFVMNRDGSGLKRVPLPVAKSGSRVVPIFGITGAGARRRSTTLAIPGMPVNPSAGDLILEIFFFDGQHLTQLTNFRRAETGVNHDVNQPSLLTREGHRVVFGASADPLGTNPSGTCQLFSIGTRGAGLRQLTHFSQPGYSVNGCLQLLSPGCTITLGGLDPATGTLVFHSSCDPFGTNPYGDQLFAIRPDGTRLRQLTHARGLVREPDGTVSSENIGPIGSNSFVGTRAH
jgi:hypothetical protein